jgi:Flp pilus assembly protein TadB
MADKIVLIVAVVVLVSAFLVWERREKRRMSRQREQIKG